MGNFRWGLCFLIYSTFIYVCYTQKIGEFHMSVGYSTCVTPGVIRELDFLLFYATLHFNTTLNINDWFYFAIYATDKAHRKPRSKVGDIMLMRCFDNEMLAHKYMKPASSCVYVGKDRLVVALRVLPNVTNSQMDYYGQWHSIDQGFRRSEFKSGPKVTTREVEVLVINNFAVPLSPDITQLNLDKSRPIKIQYCVMSLNNHTTAVRVGKELFTTAKDCLDTVADPDGLDEIQVGYEEHEGACKSAQWRVLMLHHAEKPIAH